jgi:hypothetical protein
MADAEATWRCPVPDCNKTRTTRAQVTFHPRNDHHIDLPIIRTKDARQTHADFYATWCRNQGYKVDLSFFNDNELDKQEAECKRERKRQTLATTSEPTNSETNSQPAHDDVSSPKDSIAAYDAYHYSPAYFSVLRERLKLFHDRDGKFSGDDFDVQHVALLICDGGDLAHDRYEEFCRSPAPVRNRFQKIMLQSVVRETLRVWDIRDGWKDGKHPIDTLMGRLSGSMMMAVVD